MENFRQSAYPRGSEWRRWDLHVHTPESRLGDSFSGVSWDQYLDELEHAAQANQIAAIGVTDYMSIDGYEILLKAKLDPINPRLQSVALLLPNIELRALPTTTDNKALNIHLLVDPSDPDHIFKTRRALKNLRVKYGSESYGCVRQELIELGKALQADIDDEAAYTLGIAQFKPSYELIVTWLADEGWLKDNCLVGVANGKDGISGLPLDGFSATRDQLLKRADFVFSGNPRDRAHYLGKKAGTSADEIRRMYRSLKPCLHGSDAHEISKLFRPDEDRFCWVKADPTFEGLRQVLWEPEARIATGAIKPQGGDRTRTIDELKLSNVSGWFTQNAISLNERLVAIIGEKGMGKTAIADLIAFGAGAYGSHDSHSSFISKGRIHLQGGKVGLLWGDATVTTGTLTNSQYKTAKPLVRYLSQDFVERLCSVDNEGTELQQAIEEIVFSHLSETSREGFSSFDQLRASREGASQERQDKVRGDLASLHREVDRLVQAIGQIPQKTSFKAQIDLEIERLKGQLPEVEQLADKVVLEKLELEKKTLADLETEIAKMSRRRRGIDDLLKSYVSVRERANKQVSELSEAATALGGLDPELVTSLHPTWNYHVDTAFSAMSDAIGHEIDKKTGGHAEGEPSDTANGDQKIGETTADIKARISQLQEELSKDEINRYRLLDLQKQISDQEASAKRIDREIAELTGKTRKLLSDRNKDRHDIYASYFEALASDGKGLEELYAPMKIQLAELGAEMKFELSSGYRVDTKAWLESSTRFYDGRRPAALSKKEEVEKFVIDILVPAWKSGDKAVVAMEFARFYELIDPINFMSDLASPSLKMVDLFDWMYSTDHIDITYKILYDGIELEYLSPGTRGIALLVLYLLMDEDDRRPLIIDQPEGNLDNSSVFTQLAPYIRSAKEKRQIILVTHNPNLVVATDAEQIIVASAERPSTQSYPLITYRSGSLEDTQIGELIGTRQAACILLEGGEAAFKAREGRYSIRS